MTFKTDDQKNSRRREFVELARHRDSYFESSIDLARGLDVRELDFEQDTMPAELAPLFR